MIFEMRQPATGITPDLGNCNRKIDRTTGRFSSVLWIFSVHRTEPANTRPKGHSDTDPTRYLQPATIVCGLEGSHIKNETRGQNLGVVLPHFFTSSFFVLFIQSTVLTQILCS